MPGHFIYCIHKTILPNFKFSPKYLNQNVRRLLYKPSESNIYIFQYEILTRQ
jgi:hypothetical protein